MLEITICHLSVHKDFRNAPNYAKMAMHIILEYQGDATAVLVYYSLITNQALISPESLNESGQVEMGSLRFDQDEITGRIEKRVMINWSDRLDLL